MYCDVTKKFVCKICTQDFETERAFHAHLKKHSVTLAIYYTTYVARKNLLNGKPLPFKNKKDYFSKDFHFREELLEWCKSESPSIVKPYIIQALSTRIKEKKWKKAPPHLELELRFLPSINIYKKLFNSYTNACVEADTSPFYTQLLPSNFFKKSTNFDDIEILIDTREQLPLNFKKCRDLKLDFGDYTLGGVDYNYTYVDRKTESDFKSTMTQGLQRFTKELQRAVQFNSYLYIVIESTIEKIFENNLISPRKSNLNFIFHNMINLMHEFSTDCQFIFAGNRERAQALIPRLLNHGNILWNCDMQYYLDNYGTTT